MPIRPEVTGCACGPYAIDLPTGDDSLDLPQDFTRLVPRREVARVLGTCTRTIKRLEETDPDYPQSSG